MQSQGEDVMVIPDILKEKVDVRFGSTKKAIVIQGPPGSGKSHLLCELEERLGVEKCKKIFLDSGWGKNEVRTNPTTRYDDLRGLNHDFVLIEQHYGEDAMCDPQEWVSILSGLGYTIYVFRFMLSLFVLRRRNPNGKPTQKDLDCGYNNYYNPKTKEEKDRHECIEQFSTGAEAHVRELSGDNKSTSDFADEVFKQISKV